MNAYRPSSPSTRKHVAIVLPNLGGGGAERVALVIAEDLLKRGHRVDLVLMEARGELLPLVPAAARVIDLQASRTLAALPKLRRYLLQEQPDTLHTHMWPLTVVAVIAHRLARSSARVVISGHTFLSRHMQSAARARNLRWTTRFFYPLADVRTMCSKAAADDLAELSGIPREQIEVVYNPVAFPSDIAPKAEAEAAWGGPGPRIISVGNLKAVKNHALLLDAFARLEYKNAQLVILGEGDLRPALERQAADLGIEKRVSLPGFAINPWPYYATADLFVLSSNNEGFPLVLVEAMHAGLKVVSTDCMSGPSEILENGRFGRLVPCGDASMLAQAMEATLAEPLEPDRMKLRASELTGQHTFDRFAALLA